MFKLFNKCKFEKVTEKFRELTHYGDQNKLIELGNDGVSSDYPKYLPKRATYGSAGYDIYPPHGLNFNLKPGTSIKIALNIKCKLNKNKALLLLPKSGLGSKGLHLTNTVALIDADHYYNEENGGNIMATLINNSDKDININSEKAIIQGIIIKYYKTNDDHKTKKQKRLKKGFGSTESNR